MFEYLRRFQVLIVVAVILGSLWTYAWAKQRTADAEHGMYPAPHSYPFQTEVAAR